MEKKLTVELSESAKTPEGRKTETSSAVKRRYNAKNYERVYAQLDKTLVREFKARIKENGTTVSFVIRKAAEQYLREHPPGA